MSNEKLNLEFLGEIRDVIYHSDGRVEDRGWFKNTVVTSFKKLVACLLKQETDYVGASYWAIGSGDGSWGKCSEHKLAITAGASSSNNVTITLNGVAVTVAVVSGDSASAVATKIASATFSGWSAVANGADVTFTKQVYGVTSDSVFSGGSTGVSGTFSAIVEGTAIPDAVVADTTLIDEIARKAIVPATDIVYLDDAGNVSASLTNIIRIIVTFNEDEANGTWREFALFGGNASASTNSGLKINQKNHTPLVKDNSMRVERTIKITIG